MQVQKGKFFLFEVRLLADGQVLSDRMLQRRRATSMRLIKAAVASCSIGKEAISFVWSNDGGTTLRVFLDQVSQLPLMFRQGHLDPHLAVDEKVRDLFSKLQSYCAAGVISFSNLESLHADVPHGAEFVAAHRPSGAALALNVPVRHADRQPSLQIITNTPQRVSDKQAREVIFVPKVLGAHSAKIKVISVDGQHKWRSGRLEWRKNAEFQDRLEILLFDARRRSSLLKAKLWVAATFAKSLSFHLDELEHLDLRGDAALERVCDRTRRLLDGLSSRA